MLWLGLFEIDEAGGPGVIGDRGADHTRLGSSTSSVEGTPALASVRAIGPRGAQGTEDPHLLGSYQDRQDRGADGGTPALVAALWVASPVGTTGRKGRTTAMAAVAVGSTCVSPND